MKLVFNMQNSIDLNFLIFRTGHTVFVASRLCRVFQCGSFGYQFSTIGWILSEANRIQCPYEWVVEKIYTSIFTQLLSQCKYCEIGSLASCEIVSFLSLARMLKKRVTVTKTQ